MTNTVLQVPEIHCGHCKSSLEGAVGALDGVEKVEVAIADATLDVDYNESEVGLDVIKTAIEEQGYAVFG
jgi:copper chaperone